MAEKAAAALAVDERQAPMYSIGPHLELINCDGAAVICVNAAEQLPEAADLLAAHTLGHYQQSHLLELGHGREL